MLLSENIVTWRMLFASPRSALRAAGSMADCFTDCEDVDSWLIDVNPTDPCHLQLGAALAFDTDDWRCELFLDAVTERYEPYAPLAVEVGLGDPDTDEDSY